MNDDYGSTSYRRPDGVHWGLRDAAAVVVLPLVLLGAGRLLEATSPLPKDAVSIATGIVFYGSILAIVLFASRRRGLGTLRADFGLRFAPVDILYGIGGGAITVLLQSLAVQFARASAHGTLDRPAASHDAAWYVAVTGVIAVVVAPPIEELMTRGLIMRAIRNAILRDATSATRRDIARWASIFVSGLIFALMHVQKATEPALIGYYLIGILPGGILLSWLASRTGRLGTSIAAHAALNVFVVLGSLPD